MRAEEGVSPKLTADMLGHSITRMTLDVYGHRDAANAVGRGGALDLRLLRWSPKNTA